MIVICLEGCHGSGKTELCKQFAKHGFEILDEAFMEMPSVALAPQSLTMEASWVSFWFQRLLKRDVELAQGGMPPTKEKVFIADRSPYSAVFYAGKRGYLLEPLIRHQIEELKEEANIHIITVHVSVERDTLWQRIMNRLQREPWRRKYKEDNQEWMDAVLNFYNSCTWDFVVQNNENTIIELMHTLVGRLADRLPRFQETCPYAIQQQLQLKENVAPAVPEVVAKDHPDMMASSSALPAFTEPTGVALHSSSKRVGAPDDATRLALEQLSLQS